MTTPQKRGYSTSPNIEQGGLSNFRLSNSSSSREAGASIVGRVVAGVEGNEIESADSIFKFNNNNNDQYISRSGGSPLVPFPANHNIPQNGNGNFYSQTPLSTIRRPIDGLVVDNPNPNPARKGLQNLGNTCFMNSALQCLSFAIPLTSYFLNQDWENEVNNDNPLGMNGQIPKIYADLIEELWYADGKTCFAPREFKYMIGERNASFAGYGQQDSHELLQSLLDGLHEDLNRIKKKEYVQDVEFDTKKMTERQFAMISWNNYKKRNDSIIVDLFQGQLKSRTECLVCGRESIKFDPYMYLQLPIPEPMTLNIIVQAVPSVATLPRIFEADQDIQDLLQSVEAGKDVVQELNHKVLSHIFNMKALKIQLKLPKNSTIAQLKEAVAKHQHWEDFSVEKSVCYELYKGRRYKAFRDHESVASIGNNDEICVTQPTIYDDLFYFDQMQHFLNAIDTMLGDGIVEVPVGMYQSQTNFGIPISIFLPSIFYFEEPGKTEEQVKELLGLIMYDQIVSSLGKYSIIPLYRRIGSGITIEFVLGMSERHDLPDLSFARVSDKFEPIPGLFQICLEDRRDYESRSIVLYPMELQINDSVSTLNDLPNVNVSSPKSDLSDLACSMEKKSSIETDDIIGPQLPPAPPPLNNEREPLRKVTEFKIPSESKIVMRFDFDVGTAMFGIGCYTDYQGNTAFEPASHESLKNEEQPSKPISLAQCMAEFSKEELLEGPETMYCSVCKEHQSTKKQLSVYSLPEILVIHLKRFSNSGRYSRSKIDNFIDAPQELDMSELVSSVSSHDSTYDLFAVSNHMGGLGGGHYTAYAFNPLDQQWYDCDDSHVSLCTSPPITKAAYLLFYRKRAAQPDDFSQVLLKATERRYAKTFRENELARKDAEERAQRYEELKKRSMPISIMGDNNSKNIWTNNDRERASTASLENATSDENIGLSNSTILSQTNQADTESIPGSFKSENLNFAFQDRTSEEQNGYKEYITEFP